MANKRPLIMDSGAIKELTSTDDLLVPGSVTDGTNSTVAPTLTCDSGVAIRDAVYLDGSGVIQKADATSISTAPAVGVVISKPTSVSCRVVANGLVAGFSGLTIGELYLSETAGELTSTAPTASATIFQSMGRAISTSVVLVKVDVAIERGTV